MSPGIFLDRDGVINRERSDYVKSWHEFVFLPGALQALRKLATLQWPIIIITNQSAIGRELMTDETVADIHHRMLAAISKAGGRIDGIFVCPHHPRDGCNCRKPLPGLLHHAARSHKIHLPTSYFVGDAVTDLLAAQAAGCRSILVQSGRQGPELHTLTKNHKHMQLLPALPDAVSLILNNIASIPA